MGRPAESTLVAVVPRALDGQRLDRVVAMIAGCSRSEAAALVDAGDVTIGGRAVTTRSHRVAEGDALEVAAADRAADEVLAPDPTVEVPVVYEDHDLLVVDKPAGLVVHPGAGQHSGTLVHGLLARYPEIRAVGQPDRPGHRPPPRQGHVGAAVGGPLPGRLRGAGGDAGGPPGRPALPRPGLGRRRLADRDGRRPRRAQRP